MGTDLTDEQREKIEPLLPKQGRMGRRRANDRATINGILFILRSGRRWQDVLKQYPSSSTWWRRLREWEEQGVWEAIWKTFLSQLDAQKKIDWAQDFMRSVM